MKKIFILLTVSLLFSCSEPTQTDVNVNTNSNQPCQIEDPIPVAESQNVFLADKIKLSVQDNIYREFYWTGPNGFTSNLREPEIYFATPEMSGLYYIYYKDNNCISQTKSIQINVITPTATCTVTNNTMQTSIYGNKQYNSIYTLNNSDYYTLNVSSSNGGGDLYVNFSTQTKPVAGIYKLVNSYSLIQQNEAQLTGVLNNNYIVASNGNIIISYGSNGKMNVKFCNLNFTNPSGYMSNFTASANITEN